MQDIFKLVFAQRGKHHVHVIWHNAPFKEYVALTVKVLNRISYNFGDTRVAHIALAEPAIKTALRSSKHGAQLAQAGAIGA